jgi:Fur family ferric uptake transcriptional regulator
LNNKTLIFQILKQEPNLTAPQLQRRAEEAGVQLTVLAAYRALRTYRESGGKLEKSETRCLGVVASILQNAVPGEHLTATQIRKRASERNFSLHQATVYRVLAQLTTLGFVLAIDKGRQNFYEWKREEEHHGHLTCIECGKTIEFHQEYLDDVGKQVCARLGYNFARIEFIVRSLCERCRNR